MRLNPNYFAACFGVVVTIYFWWQNVKGIHESSSKALRIMQITTVMVVILLIWDPITLLMKDDVQLPPAPVMANMKFEPHSLGWLEGSVWPSLGGGHADRVRALLAGHERV